MEKIRNKNGIFYVVISLVAILAIGSLAYAYSLSQNVNVDGDYNYYESEGQPGDVTLGAFPGPDIYSDINVHGRLTYGGRDGVFASSTTGVATGTLTEANILNNSGMDLTATGDTTHTLTLPATSTMNSLIPNAGDTTAWHFRMIGTAATASTTITAGTGIDLVENENGDVIIEAGNEAWLRFIRESDTDVTVMVDEYIAAD